MRVAVFSDVHANLPALETMLRVARPRVDGWVCLGDVVDFGPWNDECLRLVTELPGIVFIEGNHERLFLGTEPLAREIPLVQAFTRASMEHFCRVDLITGLRSEHRLGRFRCQHTLGGDLRIYPDTNVDVSESFFIGHTHHQFRTRCGSHEVINCGSVGQNRKFIDRVEFAIWDSETDDAELISVGYPVDMLIDELVARRWPPECIAYYRNKPRAA